MASMFPVRDFGIPVAVPMTGLAIRSVDLDDVDAFAGEMSSEAGTIGAGALDTDQADLTEACQPGDQATEAAHGGVERLDAEDAAVGVDGCGDVELEVSVDTAGDGDRGVLYDGHCHPFHVEGVRVGTHLPGRRHHCEHCWRSPRSQSSPDRWVPFPNTADRSFERQPSVSRFASQTRSGTTPNLRSTPDGDRAPHTSGAPTNILPAGYVRPRRSSAASICVSSHGSVATSERAVRARFVRDGGAAR